MYLRRGAPVEKRQDEKVRGGGFGAKAQTVRAERHRHAEQLRRAVVSVRLGVPKLVGRRQGVQGLLLQGDAGCAEARRRRLHAGPRQGQSGAACEALTQVHAKADQERHAGGSAPAKGGQRRVLRYVPDADAGDEKTAGDGGVSAPDSAPRGLRLR